MKYLDFESLLSAPHMISASETFEIFNGELISYIFKLHGALSNSHSTKYDVLVFQTYCRRRRRAYADFDNIQASLSLTLRDYMELERRIFIFQKVKRSQPRHIDADSRFQK